MSLSTTPAAIIAVHDLCKTFDDQTVLDHLNLQVHSGEVYGLIGENGSGKTTLIRHLIGRLVADDGTVQVCGMDPIAQPAEVLGRIGYLSDKRDLPQWMTVADLLGFMQPFYPTWDANYAIRLRDDFSLSPRLKIASMSRGQIARLGLLIAVVHRPPLLILDEPSSGLDPMARRDILAAVIESAAGDGRTVFFSSHLLDEVSSVCDRVGFLHRGHIALQGPVDELLAISGGDEINPRTLDDVFVEFCKANPTDSDGLRAS